MVNMSFLLKIINISFFIMISLLIYSESSVKLNHTVLQSFDMKISHILQLWFE